MGKEKKSFGKWLAEAWSGYSFIFVFFIIMAIYVITVHNQGYSFSWDYISAILSSTSGAVVGIIALGMALIVITGQIDLSVGATLVLVGGFATVVYNATGNLFLTILFAIAAGGVCGLLNGMMVGYAKMPPFVATLGTMLIYRSVAEFVVTKIDVALTGSSYKFQIGTDYPNYNLIRTIGTGRIRLFGSSITLPIVTIVFVILLLLVIYISTCTKYGKQVYAVGSNEKSAHLAGINTDRIKVSVYVICGMLTGIASLIQAWKNSSITPSSSGLSYEMYAIAAVVLGGVNMNGGRGKIIGIFFGALSYSTVDKIISASNLDIYIQDAFQGMVLILVVIIQTLGPVLSAKVKAYKTAKLNAMLEEKK